MGTSGRRSPRRSSRRTFSSRSCRGCPTCRCADSSACQQRGSPSAPTPASARGRGRPCPASSTKITVGVSTICPGKVAPWSTRTSLSYVAVTNVSASQCSTSLLLCKCWKFPYPGEHRWNFCPNPGPGQCFERREAREFDYVVCNPATHEWTVLPPTELPPMDLHDRMKKVAPNQKFDTLKHPRFRFRLGKYFLGFDPAIPSRFVVCVHLGAFYGMSTEMIYSSETGGWTSMQSRCFNVSVKSVSNLDSSQSTFLNGSMHFFTCYATIVTLDMERNAWKEIIRPPGMTNNGGDASIGQSQGRLYAWHIENQDDCQLSVWVLEDYDSGQWTLKCTVNCLERIVMKTASPTRCLQFIQNII